MAVRVLNMNDQSTRSKAFLWSNGEIVLRYIGDNIAKKGDIPANVTTLYTTSLVRSNNRKDYF